MVIRLNKIMMVLSLAGFISAPAFAVTTTAHSRTAPHGDLSQSAAPESSYPIPAQGPISQQLSGKDLVRIMSESQEYLPFDLDVPGQSFVSTGPYVGIPISFSGGNLIVNSPSVNTDYQLLSIRKSITTQLNALAGENLSEPYHSHLLFSGIIESQLQYFNYSKPHNGGVPPTNIDLTGTTIDMTVFGPSDWLLGFIELVYDNSSPINNGIFLSTSNYTVANSRVLVNKAFVTVGDLLCSPFYATFGQFYVPFGVYSSVYISDPFTKTLGRTKARALQVGFAQQTNSAFYGAAFIFRGDSHPEYISRINNGGLNLGYKYNDPKVNLNIGASYLVNLADSAGMQFGTNFQTYEQLVHRVGAYDARINLALGQNWDFIGEYIMASNRFSPHDMSFWSHGARPSALDLEASYSFTVGDWPSAIGGGWQHSWESLAMGIPMTRYTLVLNTSIFRNTLQGLEFRHDKEYAASAFANGAGGFPVTHQTGNSDNAVIAQFDFYF